ncbi:MAG: L,D-transpeptidase [Luteolibacter sp.]
MRLSPHSLIALGSLLLTLLTTSCGVSGGPSSGKAQRIMHDWHDDGGPGKVSIRISLTDQIAEFKRGERDIGWCYVATGKEGHATSPGSYQISEKIEDKHSGSYGWIEDEFGNVTNGDAQPSTPVPKGMVYVPAPMPYWMRITSYGIGMHGGLIPQPGEPASHGCIRMPKDFVSTLFDVVVVGTPVTITREPSHHQSLESQPAPAPFRGDYRVVGTRPLNDADLLKQRSGPRTPVSDSFLGR